MERRGETTKFECVHAYKGYHQEPAQTVEINVGEQLEVHHVLFEHGQTWVMLNSGDAIPLSAFQFCSRPI